MKKFLLISVYLSSLSINFGSETLLWSEHKSELYKKAGNIRKETVMKDYQKEIIACKGDKDKLYIHAQNYESGQNGKAKDSIHALELYKISADLGHRPAAIYAAINSFYVFEDGFMAKKYARKAFELDQCNCWGDGEFGRFFQESTRDLLEAKRNAAENKEIIEAEQVYPNALSIFITAHAGNQSSTHHALQIYFPNLGGVNLASAFMQEAFQRGKMYHDEEKLRQFFNEATKTLQDQEQKATEKKTEAKNTHNLVKKALQEEQ